MKKLILICVSIFMFSNICLASGVSPTATSADCDNATLSTYSGTTNLQANWEPNTIDITWYNGNDVFATNSCVYDDILTLPSGTPTKTGYTFDGWRVRVPGDYTELEYIESSGTQYIDTGIIGKTGISVEAKFMLNTTENGSLIGNRMASNTRFWPAMWWEQKWNATIGGDSYGKHSTTVSANTIYITYFQSSLYGWTFDVNGTRIVSGTETINNTNNMWLFGTNNGRDNPSTLQYPFKGRVYYVKIWNNGTVVRNFIPVKNSDNVVGVYDTVSQTFFTNSGTGVFIAGPVVR